MITFEDAVKTAKEELPNASICEEYKDLYVFDADSEDETDGGDEMPVIVLKSTGKLMGYSVYAVKHPEKLGKDAFIKLITLDNE